MIFAFLSRSLSTLVKTQIRGHMPALSHKRGTYIPGRRLGFLAREHQFDSLLPSSTHAELNKHAKYYERCLYCLLPYIYIFIPVTGYTARTMCSICTAVAAVRNRRLLCVTAPAGSPSRTAPEKHLPAPGRTSLFWEWS